LSSIIGVDESGKGDFFGPLVIAALLASDEQVPKLTALGARDSKLVSNNRVLEIDEKLRAEFSHSVHVILPIEYNRRYERVKNLNIFLAQGHAYVIQAVLDNHPADLAISDQFGKAELVLKALADRCCDIKLQQTVRAESIPQVAAASILARAAFIREMRKLSETIGMTLPFGAGSPVDAAGRELVRRHGVDVLLTVAKKHFKNYQRVTAR
jgi:ribonuclease HIII